MRLREPNSTMRAMVRVPTILLAAVTLAGCVSQHDARGPMPVRNQHPAQLTVMHLDPTSAAALPTGEVAARVDLAYTSMFLRGQKPGDPLTQFAMDGELLRTAAAAQVGLGSDLTLSVEVPMVGTTGGFLDSFLVGYHDLFGFPDQGRDVYPKNQFGVFADYQGQTVFAQRENAFALADIPVSLAWQVQIGRAHV